MTAEAELIAAADALAVLLEESLKHPRHMQSIAPLHKRMRRLLARRFGAQRKSFLKESAPWLRSMAEGIQEADETDAEKRVRMQEAVTARINAGAALTADWPASYAATYTAAQRAAAIAAAQRMMLDYEITLAKDAGNRYAQEYLRSRAFSQLAKDIDAVTRERMANAVADVYAQGGTYDEAVDAIRESFAEMGKSRADTIARTEIADAYNSAMLESAREAGDLVKTWNAEGPDPCPICIDNEDQGAIDLDADFSSGDDAPPAHPNCLCSVGFEKA